MRRWRVDDSAELYNINGWGMKYFPSTNTDMWP